MSSSNEKLTPKVPQRERGKRRVAALLESAAILFAQKGYDAVTMTEVAAQAESPIGSLYQFFPSKEALADALLEGFSTRLQDALDAIAEQARTQTIPELADSLMSVLEGFQAERAAARKLIDSRQEISLRAQEMRRSLHLRVAKIIRAKGAKISAKRAETMAGVIIQLMKAIARIGDETTLDRRPNHDVTNDLKHLATIYLTGALTD